MRKLSKEPAVLLVLGARKTRVIAYHEHKAAMCANLGESHKRVGSNVNSDVFHGSERSSPGETTADGYF